MKFVFDLDGTICFKGQPISDEILESLSNLTKNGHQVIFASARPIRDMLPVIREDFHHYIMIGGNGSLIFKDKKIIKSIAFSPDEFSEIKYLIEEFEATYLIDSEWDYAYTGPDNHRIVQNLDPGSLANQVALDSLNTIVKVLILASKNNDILAGKLQELDLFVNKHGNEDVIDISPKGIHKWSALKMLGIEKESYVAFGNDTNDIAMFENALHTVMIGYHYKLARVAKESIREEAKLEQTIIEKIKQISDMYNWY